MQRVCIDCAADFHHLCLIGCDKCHAPQSAEDFAAIISTESAESQEVEPEESTDRKRKSRKGQQLDPDRPRKRGRKKSDTELKDPKSTGRHRAVKLHGHADRSAPCEWRGLANCGGGRYPILGCLDGVQESVHHGPDKNTLNNERINIHKICYRCHNRWHTLNDVDYDPEAVHEHHSPREPEVEDFKADALRWANKQVRVTRGD